MIPLYDRNPTRTFPIVTVLLIAACVAIFFFVQPDPGNIEDGRFTYKNAAIPCEVVEGHPLTALEQETGDCDDEGERQLFPEKNPYLAILYSMFLHGSLLHLGGNMLFLWVFGNNIEDTFGKLQYVGFYVLAGLAATIAHIAVDPGSTIPIIGASGAIAGVMGAYLVLYPNVRIHSLIFLGFFVFFREIGAKWLLGIWFVLQFFTSPDAGVAWMAHVGGFVFGVAGGLLYRAVKGGGSPRRPAYYNA